MQDRNWKKKDHNKLKIVYLCCLFEGRKNYFHRLQLHIGMLVTGPLNQCRAFAIQVEMVMINKQPTAMGVQLRVASVMGYSTGNEKKTEIVATQRTATQPTMIPQRPKLKGPGTKDLLAKVTLKNMGKAYAMYRPIVAIETMALKATVLPRDCKKL